MIYLVTAQQNIFDSPFYKNCTVKDSVEFLKNMNPIGLDTETTGLDCWSDKLKLLQLGNKDIQIIIDCFTIDIENYRCILEDPEKTFLGWNLKFDLKWLYRHNIFPYKVYDGYLAEKLLWLGYPAGMHPLSLKYASEHYIGVERDKSIRGKVIWAGLTDDVIQYSANDVKYLEDIIKEQWKDLQKKSLTKAVRVENQFVLPLAYTEYCGIHLDAEKWKVKMNKDQKKLEESRIALNQWVVKHYPKDKRFTKVDLQGDLWLGFNTEPQCIVNWDSPKQVQILLEDIGFNLTVKDKKKGGTKKSIDAKVIKPQKNVSDIAPVYLTYKEAAKVTSTYGQNVLDQINKVSGRIHTNYNQMGADTTRITSGGKDGNIEYINLLNMPSDEETRACFTAEKGNSWISIDYSGQESALLASIANDPLMLNEINNGSGDIHSLVASLVFKDEIGDTPLKEIKHKFHSLRQIAKGYEFLVAYGGNANTIMANYGKTEEEANQIYNAYMNGLTGVQKYQAFRRKDWFNKGYILLNSITGHKAFIYDWEELVITRKAMNEPGYWDEYKTKKDMGWFDDPQVQEVRHFFKRKSASEKQSINYPIQATGSQCLRFSMIYFFEYLRENHLLNKVKICVPPYDEINCEAPADIAMNVAKKLHECMVKAGAIFCTRCKLDADISLNKDGSLPDHWVH
jgi:DNA polymerase-1